MDLGLVEGGPGILPGMSCAHVVPSSALDGKPICGGSEKLLVHPQSPLPLRDSCGWLRVQIQEVWSAVCEFTCVWVPF